MAVSTVDGLVAAFPAFGIPLLKSAFTPQVVGSWYSLWAQAGIPGAGANSADGVNGAVPTKATAGAFPFTNPTAPTLTYLGHFWAINTQPIHLMLYDRLWHNSGLSPTTVGNQALTSTTLTRPDSLGGDVEAWLQVYGVLGAGSTAKTIAYTDQDGNASNTGTLQNFVTTAAAQRTFPFALAAGDTGVRVITGFDNVATSTSGTFGLILRRQVASITLGVGQVATVQDAFQLGMPRIYDDACLELVGIANSVASQTLSGRLVLAQG